MLSNCDPTAVGFLVPVLAFEDAVVGFFEVAGVGCVVFDDRIVAPAVG